MDVSAIRAEIKAWEREFKALHGRDPTIQEIKDRPDIAEKYKLYKKLSKKPSASASASTSAPLSDDRRRTPPRDQHRPSTSSLLLSAAKHRAVRSEVPSLTSNPFSPVKQRAKARDEGKDSPSADSIPNAIPSLLASSSRTKANPFKTPSKPKARGSSRSISLAVLDEDPFPLIDAHTLASSSQRKPSQRSPTPEDSDVNQRSTGDNGFRTELPKIKPAEDAVTRARKRLRGEPVSPSPVKEKRPRTAMERVSSGPFERGNLFDTLQAVQGDDSDEEPVKRGSEDEFIGETPAKPMRGGKAFVKLFDEAVPAPVFPQARPKQAARTKSTGSGLFGFGFGSKVPSRPNGKQRTMSPPSEDDEEDMDVDWTAPQPRGPVGLTQVDKTKGDPKAPSRPAKAVSKPGMKAILPGKNNLFDDSGRVSIVSGRLEKLGIKKGPLAEDEVDDKDIHERPISPHPFQNPHIPLLPPSPPPASASGSKYTGDKGKASAKGLARKKTKLLEQLGGGDASEDDESDEKSNEEAVKVKEISWSWDARLRKNRRDTNGVPEAHTDGVADSEPEFDVVGYRSAHPESSTAQAVAAEREKFEVNLPEHLRSVLAISPGEPLTTQEDAEKVARGLIYGRLEGHYDPSRGGEIWGVGEMSEGDEEDFGLSERQVHQRKDGEDDDDWEGEPVPWEVGEL
ncbi:hypothetical protein BDW22DRAFT_1341111 [Trametopsis cervina]|nr:hypothetical protein BDW22DRAFT_1341111 [Trametopsis cervina]